MGVEAFHWQVSAYLEKQFFIGFSMYKKKMFFLLIFAKLENKQEKMQESRNPEFSILIYF